MKTTELCNFNDRIIRKDELERAQKEVFHSFLRYYSSIFQKKSRKSKVNCLKLKI
jgi:hypothetical protein